MCAYVRRTHLYYNVYKNIVLHLYFVLCRGTHNKRAQIANAKRDQKPQKMVYFCHCQRWIISVYFRIYYWVHINIHRFRYIQYCYYYYFSYRWCAHMHRHSTIQYVYIYIQIGLFADFIATQIQPLLLFSLPLPFHKHTKCRSTLTCGIQARTHIHLQSHVPELSYFPFIQRFFSSSRNRT